ncbi:Kyphoscoliosis peptidase [Aphelenchoides fujianensis]|nr:Kyphoscoliosis peptidase [Aphelenchoides fujianensis]
MVKESCHRCSKPVYPTDRVGPLKDSTFFHHGCFKCYICGTRLAIRTYCNNRDNIDDREVYCANHTPIANPHDPLPNRTAKSNGKSTPSAASDVRRVDAGLQDMKLAHLMKATQVAKPYPKIKHEGAKTTTIKLRLELIHRTHEDDLYRTFNEERRRELEQFQEETKEEWEKALADFARRYEKGVANTDQKEDLVRQLTIKRDKKLETLTHRRKERERLKTTELFDQQATEMLDLFRQARMTRREGENEESGSTSTQSYPSTPPPPLPATCSKRSIYADSSVFEQIDQKARAIYRWITVKNLNVMVFDNDLENDSPMGLLRGIKYGTESYHVLFKRLCSYAGLHCVVIKGYSKSAGYQPGMEFVDNRFRNTWNAVYVDGSWHFVQCNWGARHLVNAKDGGRQTSPQHESSLRYAYDDHYFLTPPQEFIYEFFPLEPAWQLLERPITMEQFERLPFVRSLFFRYGLRFVDPRLESVIHADENGAANISIGIEREMSANLIFHYNLRFYDSDETEVEGLTFVMQSSTNNSVLFRVHVPTTRPLLLDVFANAVSTEHYLTGQPIKFKSVCKFKAQWGPTKAYRLFNLLPTTHEDAIINCGQYCEIRFRMLKPLAEFVSTLHRNGVDDRHLQRCVHTAVRGEDVIVTLELPDEGQYGLDIYTRDASQPLINGKQLLTHCCKYLLNARVD